MFIITECPRCNKAFMYHQNETHLRRGNCVEATIPVYICHDCGKKEKQLYGSSYYWECNSCGFLQYTDSVSESDIHSGILSCSNCGEDEFHKIIPNK